MAASRGPRPRRLIGLACVLAGLPCRRSPGPVERSPAWASPFVRRLGNVRRACPSPDGPPDRRGRGL
eukprot:5490303-Alexandrium_andersonii.AAC.1